MLKTLVGCRLKRFFLAAKQTPRKVLLERAWERNVFKSLVGCCLKGFGAEHVQNPRRVLFQGLGRVPKLEMTQKYPKIGRLKPWVNVPLEKNFLFGLSLVYIF